jgi:hypothetical protein
MLHIRIVALLALIGCWRCTALGSEMQALRASLAGLEHAAKVDYAVGLLQVFLGSMVVPDQLCELDGSCSSPLDTPTLADVTAQFTATADGNVDRLLYDNSFHKALVIVRQDSKQFVLLDSATDVHYAHLRHRKMIEPLTIISIVFLCLSIANIFSGGRMFSAFGRSLESLLHTVMRKTKHVYQRIFHHKKYKADRRKRTHEERNNKMRKDIKLTLTQSDSSSTSSESHH